MSTLQNSDHFAVERGGTTYKVSYADILKGVQLPPVMEYMGVANPAASVPAPAGGLKVGMVYAMSPAGKAHATWAGIGGLDVADGQLAIWEGAKWELAGANGIHQPDATTTAKGIVELATTAEVLAGTDATRAVTPSGVKAAIGAIPAVASSTETVKGIVELATAAETTTGTDNTRAVHPAGLKAVTDAERTTSDTKYVDVAGDTMTGDLKVPSLNGGQLAGFRNIIINGTLSINQRNVTIAAAAVGQYGPDRWKKTGASTMTQIIENGNFEPGAVYTLSGTGITTQQITAPASGNWTLPDIPTTATKIQVELGTVATPFERRPIGAELALCQRYYFKASDNPIIRTVNYAASPQAVYLHHQLPVTLRAEPTLSATGDINNGAGFSTWTSLSAGDLGSIYLGKLGVPSLQFLDVNSIVADAEL